MLEFLKIYKDYQGSNTKLKAFAKQLAICEDGYEEMFDELIKELGEQGDGGNPMYDCEEHALCWNEL